MTHHSARLALAIGGVVALAACGDSTSAPPPTPLVIPAFLVVGDDGGFAQIYRVADSVETKLSTTESNDADPQSAAGRIVFSTDLDGNAEVYIGDTSLTVTRRVTVSAAQDDHPAIDPTGNTIVFVSNRSGAPRLWTVPAPALDAVTFDTPVALETGSSTATPESAPAWSPDGGTIAFSSTRTGRSEIFTVPASGGSAVQVTNEVGGAFNPAWSGDGGSIYYTATVGVLHVRRVKLSSSSPSDFATDSLDLDAASCNASLCLAAEDPSGALGSILAFPTKGGNPVVVLARTHNEREATIPTH
jgi:Tol biopolymer transport system component